MVVRGQPWSTMFTRAAINHVDDETWLIMVNKLDHETRLTMVFKITWLTMVSRAAINHGMIHG